jgi:hypothetical protein
MTTPTHDEIARQAQEFWQDRGCPTGCDTAIWLEAEQALTHGLPSARFSAQAVAETAAESQVEFHVSPALPDQEAIQIALQKQEARAPQLPHHTGPKAKPAETGKPVWPKAHSS